MAAKSKKKGRPLKLTKALQTRICKYIKQGNYLEQSAVRCGVSKSTFMSWRAKGREEDEGVYRDFLDATTRAEAEAEATLVASLTRDPDWRARLAILSRRYPDRWGKKVEVDALAGQDGKLKVVVAFDNYAEEG